MKERSRVFNVLGYLEDGWRKVMGFIGILDILLDI